MSYFETFWGTGNWGRLYGFIDAIYSLGFHIGQDILTRGPGGYGIGGVPIPALAGGRVVQTGSGSQIGFYIVVQVGDRFHTYCHLRGSSISVSVGDVIARGQIIAVSGGAGDFLGAADASHLHFVISTAISTAYSPVRSQVVDPRPIILSALTSAAGDSGSPFEDKDIIIMSSTLYAENDSNVWSIDREALTRFHVTPGQWEILKFQGDGLPELVPVHVADGSKLNAFTEIPNPFGRVEEPQTGGDLNQFRSFFSLRIDEVLAAVGLVRTDVANVKLTPTKITLS